MVELFQRSGNRSHSTVDLRDLMKFFPQYKMTGQFIGTKIKNYSKPSKKPNYSYRVTTSGRGQSLNKQMHVLVYMGVYGYI